MRRDTMLRSGASRRVQTATPRRGGALARNRNFTILRSLRFASNPGNLRTDALFGNASLGMKGVFVSQAITQRQR